MKFFIASDHAGFTLKAFVVQTLGEMGHSVEDLGPSDSNRVDYPDLLISYVKMF